MTKRATRVWAVMAAMAVGAACQDKAPAGEGTAAAAPARVAASEAHEPAPAVKAEPAKAADVAPAPAPADRLSLDPPADVAAAPAGAARARSGIATTVLRAGTGGVKPKPDDRVIFHYVAWRPSGERAGSSYDEGAAKEMKFTKLISGWREVLSDMVAGERRRAWIPAALAHPRKKKGADLEGRTVDLELVAVASAPAAPPDLRKPPKDAKRMPSGLTWRTLSTGKGDRGPGPEATVRVRYAGWNAEGRCFDFTGPDETATFGVDGVIAGWSEGLQLMVQGDRTRFWIPGKLAYDGKPGKPQGTLVFDVELVEIVPARP